MNIFLMIAIIIANGIAIGILYKFVKKLPQKQKIILIATSVASMYILINIIYWISGFGIKEEVHEPLKQFITFLFVPVNVILFCPYIAIQYKKLKDKKIKIEKFASKMSIIIVIMIIILVMEGMYFNKIQRNLEDTMISPQITEDNKNENSILNETINEVNTNAIENDTKTNIVGNEIILNSIVN